MTAFLRACSDTLNTALFDGSIRADVDLFTITSSDGATVIRRASWDRDLVWGGHTYYAGKPWNQCSGWDVANTMTVPTMTLTLSADNSSFNGGASIKAQIGQGLLDGATVLLTQAYLVAANDGSGTLVILDALDVFAGKVGGIDLDGVTATITVKGRVNDLDQSAPRNLYQVPCSHAFCDPGCTLARATYTASYAMGTSPTTTFIPWASAPSTPARYQNGTLAVTAGAASGSRRTIVKADSSGLTLSYPLNVLPASGDAFTAFEGCDKSYNSGSVQSCTARSNTQHYRGYEFVPPPNTAV